MKTLYNEYIKEYDFIYQAAGKYVAGFDEAVAFFDNVIMINHMELLTDFNEFMGDVVMSDREAAAFVFACENLGRL